jgi:hypothetical protein
LQVQKESRRTKPRKRPAATDAAEASVEAPMTPLPKKVKGSQVEAMPTPTVTIADEFVGIMGSPPLLHDEF